MQVAQKRLFVATGSLQLFISIGAIPVGIMFIINPTGGVIMPLDILANSPFRSFLIPGIYLLMVNGLATLAGSIISFKEHIKAGMAALILGFGLIGWIVAQVYWIGLSSWLQPVYFGLGVIEVFFGYKLQKSMM